MFEYFMAKNARDLENNVNRGLQHLNLSAKWVITSNSVVFANGHFYAFVSFEKKD